MIGNTAVVDAFYSPTMNSIILPAGILQDVFFNSIRPHYLNYAAIGWIIGHELTHGFDNQGSQFDENGDLVNWWDPETLKKYLNRTECIIQQYSNYTLNGLKLNGQNTQSENVADIGGIKEAYFAYEEYEKTHEQEFGLPGLPYTPRQLFWISAANIYCDNYRAEVLEHVINTDIHSPCEIRVNGSFSNIPEFSRDFNCPVGSPMNPIKKCTVWLRKPPLQISLDRRAILIVVFYSFVNVTNCAVTTIGFKNKDINSKNVSQEKVCETQACIEAASLILKNIDSNAVPCDNFYQFACGKFLKESVIPESKHSVSSFTQADEKLWQQLRTSLERKMDQKAPRTFRVLQSFYNTCLDIAKIDETSTYEILNILKKLGDWPVLVGQSWNASDFDWKKLIYQMREIGYTEAMKCFIYSSIDVLGNNKYEITLDQAPTGLEQEYLSKGFQDKIVQAYYKYMTNLAEVLGADEQQSKKDLRDSLDFEIELSKIFLPKEDRRNMSELYNPMTLQQLESRYPDIPWREYFNNTIFPLTKFITFNNQIIVQVPSFLKSLINLINNTPKRVLANYAIWRVVQESASFMNERVKRIKADFSASTTGTNIQEQPWVECLEYLSKNLRLALGALYAREHFDKKSKKVAEELVHGVHKSFLGLLEKVDWMDEATKDVAKKKLRSVKEYVAYPDEFLDDEKIDTYFQDLAVHSESFLKNHLNLNLFKLNKHLEELEKLVNETDWTKIGYTAIVEAFYGPAINSIILPAGILQDVFFNSSRPHYLNYAAIGWITGHELTHGFDDQGSQYDVDGNLVNWWNPETFKKYRKRTECIVQQYSNYTLNGLKLNGKNTQGENIADNGGIKEAYFAYEEYEKTHEQELGLPGLPYTPRQLFWINAANIWCGKFRPEALEHGINTDVHSPFEYRVIGPFSNIPEFSRDFNCPVGSPMNPIIKCTIW
ncbi:neprilysin-2-like [Phymastichus coffea]|uniref:neprilysin-2-like n=1 Tax=Phymastichus coffea TaxID=108790 RepID=UPI00273C7696|nr:neprilysin-2-like [Phymastichus coffea]